MPYRPTHLLPLLIRAALLGLPAAAAVVPVAQAQSAQQSFAFDIAAGALSTALTQVAAQSGTQLTANARLTAGKNAPALRGTMTLQQALDRLLAGSGLSASVEGMGIVVRERTATLKAVKVTADTEYEAATSYRVTRASAATKSDTPLIDTPASVTVLTQALVRDQFAQTSAEVLRNVPAITPWSTAGNVGGTLNSNVRGFYTATMYKDGQRINSPGHQFLDNIETIEVLKGPASVLYGAVQPGGMLAFSRKKPQAEARREISVSFGSDEYKKLGVDLTGPLLASGELQYRLVAAGMDTDQLYDHGMQKTTFVAPSLRWQANDWLVDIGYEYGREESTMGGNYQPVEGREKPDKSFSRKLFLGSPDNIRKQDEDTAHVQITRELGEDSSITASYLNTEFIHESYSYRLRNYDPDTRIYSVSGTVIPPTRNNDEDAFELRGAHRWSLGGTRNTLTAGAEARKVFSEYLNCSAYFLSGSYVYSASIDAPDYSHSPLDLPRDCRVAPEITRYDGSESTKKERAAYVQNLSWLTDDLQVLAGLRYARIETENFNTTRNTVTSEQKDSAVTGRFGLLYKVAHTLSLYASYSESFEQLIGRRFDGGTFEPTEGKQIEAGFKQEIGHAAFITGSVFRIEQLNLTRPDPVNIGFSTQEGEVHSDGVELEISGDVLPRLSLSGGVMYLDNEVIGGSNDGRSLNNTYRVKASLWANYRLHDAWTLGAGAFYHGKSYLDASNQTFIPTATTFDMALKYSIRLGDGIGTLRLNAKNIFDEWDYVGYGYVEPQPGRQFYASFGYEF